MNCEEGETNINGINNDSIVGQSASKIDPTQCAVMSGGYCECRRNSIAKSELKPTVGGSACTCHYLPSFSFSLSPQFLSDRTKTILPSPQQDFKPTDRRREGERRHICACTPMPSIQVVQTKGDGKLIYLVEASYLFLTIRAQGKKFRFYRRSYS